LLSAVCPDEEDSVFEKLLPEVADELDPGETAAVEVDAAPLELAAGAVLAVDPLPVVVELVEFCKVAGDVAVPLDPVVLLEVAFVVSVLPVLTGLSLLEPGLVAAEEFVVLVLFCKSKLPSDVFALAFGLSQPDAGLSGDFVRSPSVAAGFSTFDFLDFLDFLPGFSDVSSVAGLASCSLFCHMSSNEPSSCARAADGITEKVIANSSAHAFSA
jgi:hypothetical protein